MDYMDKIKQLRKERGLTQEDMAEALKTTQQQYSKYENEVHELPIRHLITICKLLKISADEMLGLEEEKKK